MSFLLGLGALLVAAAGAAAPSQARLPIELGWDGPASCPVSDDIERDVRRFLGDADLQSTMPPVAARVSVRESAERSFEVRMVTMSGGETRERVQTTGTCDEARDLVAFLLALLVDPRAREPSREPAPTEPVVVPPQAPLSSERAPAPGRASAAGGSVRFIAGVSGSAALGLLPGASVGVGVRAGLLLSGWSLEGRGGAFPPRRVESAQVPEAGGEFVLVEAGLFGCFRGALSEALAAQACMGSSLLLLRGEGYGVRAPGRDQALFASASAEAALLIALSPVLSLRPAVGALVPFRRPTFSIHDLGAIHRPSAVAARGFLGLEAQF